MTATAKLTDAELERMMYLLRVGRNGDATAEEHQEAEKLLRRYYQEIDKAHEKEDAGS